MFKSNSPVTKLGSAIALCLLANTASAATIYSTYKYLFNPDGSPITGALSGTDELSEIKDDWVAGYFFVNPVVCSNGCDITGASLQLVGNYNPFDSVSLAGMKLEIYSNTPSTYTNIGKDMGTALFQLESPTGVNFNGNFGTKIQFTATAPQDQNSPALLQPNTAYWLKLTNIGQTSNIGWFFNGLPQNEFWLAHYDKKGGEGSPYIFEIQGTNSKLPRIAPSNVPLPGAIWMMGSALIGLLGFRNKISRSK